MMSDTKYLFVFNSCPLFGPKRLGVIYEYFGSFGAAYEAPLEAFTALGFDRRLVDGWGLHRRSFDVEKELGSLVRFGILLLDFREATYPQLLLEMQGFPPLLYYRGTLPAADALCLAVVGSRKVTSYGQMALGEIVEPLIDHGIIVVSGLALGVDGLAHKKAFERERATVAVLGSGLADGDIYPKQHQLAAAEIIARGGLLLSEYPVGMPALKQNFVMRNRIIAGLSVGTLVIEAAERSGSLITAQYALAENRSVYAVPGPIFSEMSAGTNNLLKVGAKAVTSAADILQDLNITPLADLHARSLHDFSATEQVVLKLLDREPVAADELTRKTELTAAVITATLTYLEMKGAVRNLGGQLYVRVIHLKISK